MAAPKKTSARAITVRLAADELELDAAGELAARVFGPNYFDAVTTQRLRHELDPPTAANSIVAIDGGEVVGLARLVARSLRFRGRAFRVAGVTDVCVAPTHRNRELGLALMRTALNEARRRGDQISVLFARRAVDGWYPRFGFRGIGQHVEFRLLAGARAVPHGRIRIEHGARADSFAAYASAYESSYGSLPGVFFRPGTWWRQLATRLRVRPSLQFFTLRTAGRRVAGYALVEGERIWEIAVRGRGAGDAGLAMIGALEERGRSNVSLNLHPCHPTLMALSTSNHELAVRRAWNGGHMAAALDRKTAGHLALAGVGVGAHTGRAAELCPWPVWSPFDEL